MFQTNSNLFHIFFSFSLSLVPADSGVCRSLHPYNKTHVFVVVVEFEIFFSLSQFIHSMFTWLWLSFRFLLIILDVYLPLLSAKSRYRSFIPWMLCSQWLWTIEQNQFHLHVDYSNRNVIKTHLQLHNALNFMVCFVYFNGFLSFVIISQNLSWQKIAPIFFSCKFYQIQINMSELSLN